MRSHIVQFSCALLLSLSSTASFAIPTNLLDNAGFETGDYSGWAVSGNSTQVGVATDGTVIQHADDPFNPNFQNVRSGNYAGNALVQNGIDPVERIILTQTISVLQYQNVDVGFWLGNDSNSAFGMNIDDSHTQIFIDGLGLLANDFLEVPTGSTSADFLGFGGSFNTGNRTSITVSYAFNGSGTSRVGISFDDLYFNSEAASVPEPAIVWLLGMGLGLIGFARRKA